MASSFTLPDTMTPYDREAWLCTIKEIQDTKKKQNRLGKLAKSGTGQLAKAIPDSVADSATSAIVKIKENEKILATTASIEATVGKAIGGLNGFTIDQGMYSVNPNTTVKRLKKRGYEVENLDDVRKLPLKVVEYGFRSKKKRRYQVAGFAQGAATSLVTTGGFTISPTVGGGPGVGVAVGAIVADAVTTIAGMGRIIGSVAASYGYDINEPNEAVYAAGVLPYALATTPAEKITTLTRLSNLTQKMMRRTSMKQLQRDSLVKIINQVFKAVGVKLTKKKLAGYIPYAGVAINAGLGVKLASETMERAHQVYRLRFLSEQYGLDSDLWITQFEVPENPEIEKTDTAEIEDAILIDEMFDEAIAEQTDAEEHNA